MEQLESLLLYSEIHQEVENLSISMALETRDGEKKTHGKKRKTAQQISSQPPHNSTLATRHPFE